MRDPVGARQADEVIGGRGRAPVRAAAGCGSRAPARRARRALPAAAPVRWPAARARVTATVIPASGARPSQASSSASAGDRPDDRDRRRAHSSRAGELWRSSQACPRPCAGRAACRVRRPPPARCGARPAAIRRARSSAGARRPCRRRACRERPRARPSRALPRRLAGSSWPVTSATPLAQPAVGDGDARVGGRGHAGGDARDDLERDRRARSASASSPPRPNTNGSPPFRRTTSRPARARSIISSSVCSWGTDSPPPSLPTNSSSASARAPSSAAAGIRRS